MNLIDWLLEDNNPAISYRTKVELLGEPADKQPVIDWISGKLPTDWRETKGLWYIYYLTAISECGLKCEDIGFTIDKENIFGYGCADFMYLRALIKLGIDCDFILSDLKQNQLPDGGFLCTSKLKKFKYIPKSCVKSNYFALMVCSECKKRGIDLDITDDLLGYFWNHNIFYKTSDLSTLMMNGREGWRIIDTFHPFEPMRIGIHNIVEAFCGLGYGNDIKLQQAWDFLYSKKDIDGKYLLNSTLTKSYLPKERVGKPSKWVTFYALLAEKEKPL